MSVINKKNISLTLSSSIDLLPGIGPKKSAVLFSSNITTVFDLLRIYPTSYQDRKNIIPFSALRVTDEPQGIFKAKLLSKKVSFLPNKLKLISAEFEDESKRVSARWFNKTYLLNILMEGSLYYLFGKSKFFGGKIILSNPDIESTTSILGKSSANKLTPIYPSSSKLAAASITPLSLRRLIENLLTKIDWDKSFPQVSSQNNPFDKIKWAIKEIHMPDSNESAVKAQKILAFLDQVLFQIGVFKRREHLTGKMFVLNAAPPPFYQVDFELPYKLTDSQSKVLTEIIADLDSNPQDKLMNRLMQGDVGSGKTIVAFIAMRYCATLSPNSGQTVFMAPTEILAWQHYKNFCALFPDLSQQALIITGSLKQQEKKHALQLLKNSEAMFVFGTHALFQDSIFFSNLKFCVIDEQQRFGVEQRRLLYRKGEKPHQLLLSATPIPRTLSLTIFGDMDSSIIDELPAGRKPVKTILSSSFEDTLPFILSTIKKDQQVYMVCPIIEDSEKLNCVSVQSAAQFIKANLPQITFDCLTGQQSWQEKDEIMQQFNSKNLHMLIATTVVEVGVDNPDASLMIIVNADRFGLSQLHQLRGRVGRGKHKSTCILLSFDSEISQRLKIMESTNDGFILSVEDLKIRGPGDILGTRQSGLSHPCFSYNLGIKTIENAKKRAFEILTDSDSAIKSWFEDQMIRSFKDSYKTFMEGG